MRSSNGAGLLARKIMAAEEFVWRPKSLSEEASVTSIATDAHWLPGSNAAFFFWYHDPLALCIRQMSLELSDAEIRRLRDLDAFLTHVVIIALSDVDCQASMDRMLFKFATLSAQEIPKLKSLASFI